MRRSYCSWNARVAPAKRVHSAFRSNLPGGGIEETQWTAFTSLMQGVLLRSTSDRLGWTIDVSDSFTVYSLRGFFDSHMLHSGGPETRWNNWVPIKVNIFIWRLQL